MTSDNPVKVVQYYAGVQVENENLKSGSAGSASSRRGFIQLLRSAFLPEGFPESVTPDYAGFQTWDTIQALSSYVRGMLSSQAILKGVGVGQQAATPLGAVFQFFVRDLLGMLGSIIFTYIEGSNFDSCAKQWRLFADITNDMGMAIELASPFFPSLFLFMACLGSLARSLTGVAGGATRAALTMHFAKQGNAADIAAKEQSQETATTMIGMVLGMLVTRVTADSFWLSWVIFIVLTYVHIHANVKALRCLVLTSLNKPRLEYIMDTYLKQGGMTTPLVLSEAEDLTPPPYQYILRKRKSHSGVNIVFGSQASTLMAVRPDLWTSSSPQLPVLAQLEQHSHGALKFRDAWKQPEPSPYVLGCADGHVMVVVRKAASPAGMLQAYVHACVLRCGISEGTEGSSDLAGQQAAEREAATWMADKYASFVDQLRVCGWSLDKVRLPRPVWTADWFAQDKKTK